MYVYFVFSNLPSELEKLKNLTFSTPYKSADNLKI